jgi:RNA polymerase sigma factor FliA
MMFQPGIKTDAQPEEVLWKMYREKKSDHIREKLVIQYMPLVKYVIGRQLTHLPSHLSREDLMSAGIIGLINAVEKFDSDLEVQFKTYAIPRIKGAILDELRSYDVIPRSIRLKMREVQEAIQNLEKNLKRSPSEEEIADYLEINVEQYRDLLRKLSPIRFLSLSQKLNNEGDWDIPDDPSSMITQMDQEEVKQQLIDAIQTLERNERLMVALYYYEKMTMKEISIVLKVSESRVSQIHTQALLKLRSALDGHYKG